MDLQTIYLLVSLGFDVLITFIVLIKRKSGQDTTTIEELAEKAQAKADKYFAKQCKKHHLHVDSAEETGGDNETTKDEA